MPNNRESSVYVDHSPNISRGDISIKIGQMVLFIFLLLRPATVSFHHIGSISLLDIFGTASSYLMIIGLLFNLKRLRLDLTSILILFFVLYCIISIAWGSEYRDVARMTLPFLPFFLVRSVVNDERSIIRLTKVHMLAYTVPIFGSIFLMATGASETMVTGSMIERQAGLSSGVHTLGHLLLFFSFTFGFYLLVQKDRSKLFRWVMFVFLIGSLFCIYKTYTRTVFLGGGLFWFTYLFYFKRKYFYLTSIIFLSVAIFKFDVVRNMVTQENAYSQTINKKGLDLNAAGSGRLGIWEHNLTLYSELPLISQLVGVGLGNELKPIAGTVNKQWIGSHNDYLSLLIMTGVVGLFIYLMIYASLLRAIMRYPGDKNLKMFSLAVLFAVIIMNFVSNSYIVRFQMAQLFWFLMGLLYVKYNLDIIKNKTSRKKHVQV